MYELNPIGIFHEKEGVTFILEQQDAVNKKIHYQSVYRLITLNVHSSLDAVGLTAAFMRKKKRRKRRHRGQHSLQIERGCVKTKAHPLLFLI